MAGIFDKSSQGQDDREVVDLTGGDSNAKNIESAAQQINSSFGGPSSNGAATDEEMKMLEVTDEELELAEAMLFNGYAKKDYPIPALKKKGIKVTVCSTTPHEVSFVNQVVMKVLDERTDKEGNIKFPNYEIEPLRAALNVALTFLGFNDKDICDDLKVTSKLQVLKNGIKEMSKKYANGDIAGGDADSAELIAGLRTRSAEIKNLPLPLMEFVTDKVFDFERRMYEVMSKEGVVPKSSSQSEE